MVIDLGRQPNLSSDTELDPGIKMTRAWFGQGVPRLEVCELALASEPTAAVMRRAWERRRNRRPVPVIVFVEHDGAVRICGPEGSPAPICEVSLVIAQDILAQALELPASDVVPGFLALLARSQGSGGIPGFRNRQLLSTHYLAEVLPTREPAEWKAFQVKARLLRRGQGRELLKGLGFTIQESAPREFLLLSGERPVALAHVYPAGTSLDRIRPTEGSPPAAQLVSRARARGVERGLLVAGPVIRLYTTRPDEEFEESVAPAAYIEVETRLLPDERLGLLWACFSAEALDRDGSLEMVMERSRRYAIGLRERFKERVYGEVVPRLVKGLGAAADVVAPDILYRSTLALLFRLLFVLYAEDRNLLPLGNPYYRQHSLTARLDHVRRVREGDGRGFDGRATDLWDDLVRIFGAIREGHHEWGVPPYDGGLFEDDDLSHPEGGFLAHVKVPNAVIGPALYDLAIDRGPDGIGKVDFGDLGVRHLGTIYEGLLSYQVAVATQNMTVDPRDPEQLYRPASSGEEVKVARGDAYMLSPKGGRKATGSYYTPAFVVDRLVERAMMPALERHLGTLRALADDKAAERLFDFKVCDPAMGSGHFLVQALDGVTESIASYLVERRLPRVIAELDRARAQITAIGREYGAEGLGDTASDVDLIRRLVLKRCIYGVDLNPMAVELSHLSLWLHAFVPGLPLSYLGHTLRNGNSLVGVAGPELEAQIEHEGLFAGGLKAAVSDALDDARSIGGIPDLELGEVAESRRRQAALEAKTASLRDALNLYSASCFAGGVPRRELVSVLDDLLAGKLTNPWRGQAESAEAFADEQRVFHWQLEFPEVFLRESGGFDAVLANPPWEEVTVEELGFFVRYLPGLKSERSQAEQQRRIKALSRSHPELRERYEVEVRSTGELRTYLAANYVLTQSGDPDLYKAFAERFLQVCRVGGSIGVVLPRAAFSADGTAPFRERLFSSCTEVQLDFLLNNRQWVFSDVHPQYTFTLAVARVGGAGTDTVVSTAGPASDRIWFDRLDQERIDWKASELRLLSPGMEVPLIPGRAAGELFHRLCSNHPPFAAASGGFKPVPWAELHMTKDRKSGLLRETGAGWPAYGGDSFDLWNPYHMKPPFVVPHIEGLEYLHKKRRRSTVWSSFPPSVRNSPKSLPQHRARVLFRDVTNRTNSRTVIACLVPPRVFAVNSAPSLIFPLGDDHDVAYVLGVMCSLPFDWLARRRVETHVNYFILESLPMPRPGRADPVRERVVALAGRLSCPDDRFSDWARSVDVEVGPLDPETKLDLIAELDVAVAQLYGLSSDDLKLMFDDFPETEEGISTQRRRMVMEKMKAVVR